ncbi:MAG TPA: hypothetical protein VFV27_05175 [Nevskiaceae bacterium]|nr:hypothetical protein [Nevskiaceae bacterium]
MRAWLVPLCLPLLGACAGLPDPQADRLAWTDGLAQEFQLSADDRRRLQYFVSDTIRLVRSESAGQMGIRDGRLVSIGERAVDEVVVDRGTPGVLLANGPGWMAVSFEEGSYLYFSTQISRYAWLGEAYDGNRYYLHLPNWNGREGTVSLAGQTYTAIGDSGAAHLLVDREAFFDARSAQRVQRGRLID